MDGPSWETFKHVKRFLSSLSFSRIKLSAYINFKIGQVIRTAKYILRKPYINEQFHIGENLGQADYNHYSITSLLELYLLFCFQLYREALDAQIWIQSSFSLDAILREEIPQLIPCQNLLLPKLRWK